MDIEGKEKTLSTPTPPCVFLKIKYLTCFEIRRHLRGHASVNPCFANEGEMFKI